MSDDSLTDTASPGQQAELEALGRQTVLEAADLLGFCGVHILWDVSIYYDSRVSPQLIDEGEVTGYPMELIAIILQVHNFSLVQHRLLLSRRGNFESAISSSHVKSHEHQVSLRGNDLAFVVMFLVCFIQTIVDGYSKIV